MMNMTAFERAGHMKDMCVQIALRDPRLKVSATFGGWWRLSEVEYEGNIINPIAGGDRPGDFRIVNWGLVFKYLEGSHLRFREGLTPGENAIYDLHRLSIQKSVNPVCVWDPGEVRRKCQEMAQMDTSRFGYSESGQGKWRFSMRNTVIYGCSRRVDHPHATMIRPEEIIGALETGTVIETGPNWEASIFNLLYSQAVERDAISKIMEPVPSNVSDGGE